MNRVEHSFTSQSRVRVAWVPDVEAVQVPVGSTVLGNQVEQARQVTRVATTSFVGRESAQQSGRVPQVESFD